MSSNASKKLILPAALKANLLVVYDIDAENNTKQILSAKEQEFYWRPTFGDLATL